MTRYVLGLNRKQNLQKRNRPTIHIRHINKRILRTLQKYYQQFNFGENNAIYKIS